MAQHLRYYPYFDGHPRRLRLLYFSLFALLILLLLGLNLLAFSFYAHESTRSLDTIASRNVEVTLDGELVKKKGAPGPIFEIAVMDVDPLRSVMKVNTKVIFDANTRPGDVLNGTLLLGSYRSVVFNPASTFYLDQDVTVMMDGDAAKYPFDKYVTEIPFAATRTSVLANPLAPSIEFGAIAFGALQNFRFTFAFRSDPEKSSIVYLDITVKRAPTTKGFAIFVVIVMWCLTLGAVLVTFQILFRRREIAPPLIGVFIALLFALPAVRNTQPAAPPIGTLLDTVSLFWNMMLVALCAIVLMFGWVAQSPSPQPPKGPFSLTPTGQGVRHYLPPHSFA